VLDGIGDEEARISFGLTELTAASVLNRAADHLRSLARQHATKFPDVIPSGSDFESVMATLQILRSAVDQFPRRALAAVGVRSAKRLFPFIAAFAETFPGGREQFQATEAAIRGLERFALGEPVPAELANLTQTVQLLERATRGLGEPGAVGTRAYCGLFFASSTLRLAL